MKSGQVYRREELFALSSAVDRDLAKLVRTATIDKIAPGLYYKPRYSRFGKLPPSDKQLVKKFLKSSDFLIVFRSDYNSLEVGLTQLYNQLIVYNHKRHGVFELAGKKFDFRRPAFGFPKKLTDDYLLVDLLNNLKELDEDVQDIKGNIRNLNVKLLKKASLSAKKYGKVNTKKFFKELILP